MFALRGRRGRSVIYGTRRGKVTYVAVTDCRVRRSKRVLRSYLRLARLTSKGKRRKARRRRR